MLRFLRFKKEDELYPNFSKRMLSSVIDLSLLYLIISPIWHFLSLIIYAGPSPVTQLRNILQETISQNKNGKGTNLYSNQAYLDFVHQNGYWPFIQEQLLQLTLISIFVLWFWLKYNSTPGKMLLSLKIVDSRTLKKPSILQLIIRMLSCAISVLPLGIGFLSTIFNKKNMAWHDFLSSTVIIKTQGLAKNDKAVQK